MYAITSLMLYNLRPYKLTNFKEFQTKAFWVNWTANTTSPNNIIKLVFNTIFKAIFFLLGFYITNFNSFDY